jgi:hypothetical protein
MGFYKERAVRRADGVLSRFPKVTGSMKLLAGLIICMIFVTSVRAGRNVTLAWNASADPVVAGYNIYYGGTSRVYTNKTSIGLATNLTISNLVSGMTYYFTATTHGAAGVESAFAGEVSYTVPMPLQLSGSSMGKSIFSFILNGPIGSSYVIQMSTDLAHWLPFSTNTIPPGGSISIADPNPNSAQKFYRALPYPTASASQSPRLSGFSMSKGVFSFILSGSVGHTYDIQATQDFKAWTAIRTATVDASGLLDFTDTNAADFSRRFYRSHETLP